MDVDIVEFSAMNPPAEPIVKEKNSKKGIKRDTAENSESENEKLNACQAKKSKSTLSASKTEIVAYKATIEEPHHTVSIGTNYCHHRLTRKAGNKYSKNCSTRAKNLCRTIHTKTKR